MGCPNRIVTSKQDLVLVKLKLKHAFVMFDLIESNTEYLSQFGDNTAEKYKTLDLVRKSILRVRKVWRFGIWYNNEFVGYIKITPTIYQTAEIGYWMGQAFAGKGIMTCACKALTEYALENGFDYLFAKVVVGNLASVKVLQRCGYKEIVSNKRNHWKFGICSANH